MRASISLSGLPLKSSIVWRVSKEPETDQPNSSELANRVFASRILPTASGPPPANEPLARRVAAFDHDGLDLAPAVAAEGRGALVFGRGEAGDALLEGREFDHHEAVEFCRPFQDLIATAAREHLAAELGDDSRHEIGVLLVFDRIVDLRPRNPIGRHGDFLARMCSCLSCLPPIKSGKGPASSTLGGPSCSGPRT